MSDFFNGEPEDGEPVSDLVERLREAKTIINGLDLGPIDLCVKAADEIERLRTKLRDARKANSWCTCAVGTCEGGDYLSCRVNSPLALRKDEG